MAFSVTSTTLNGNAARIVTGSGNLSDLASALSTHGVTIAERVLTFSGTGANTSYCINGTLTETRDGVWTVLVGLQSFICWGYGTSSSVTLGALTSDGSRTSRVDIRYLTNSYPAGNDPHGGRPYDCFVGEGSMNFVAGSLSYECSSRSDLDIYDGATSCIFDAVEVQLTSTGGSYSHIFSSANVSTTGNSRFSFMDSGRRMEAVSSVSTVQSFSCNTGLNCLGLSPGDTRTIIKAKYPQLVMFAASGGTGKAYDPNVDYFDGVSNSATLEIYRTLNATFTDQLGTSITSPAPNLVSLVLSGSPVTTAFSAGAAAVPVRQSYVPPSTSYGSNGAGYTDDPTYSFYAVGFGYASQYLTVNVKTAHAGNAGITWRATAIKSALVVTPYGSVVTSGFSFNTGTDTLSITTSRTSNQAAEYLFKQAYDNPANSYWLAKLHVPATLDTNGVIDFGATSLTVTGVALSGTALTNTGTITLASGATSSVAISKASGSFIAGPLDNVTGTVTLTGTATWEITTSGTAPSGSAAAGNTIKVTSASSGANFDFQAFVFNSATTFENTSGNPITLILGSGQTAPTLLPTSGSITISAPIVQQSVTVTGVVAGSRVQIYDTTNNVELFNGTSGYSWTDPAAATGSRDIRVRIAKQSGTSAYLFVESNVGTCGTTAPSNAVTYLANQALDTVYNTNAIDGSAVTGITIVDATDRMQINIAGGSVSWKEIYAYNVYWLTTSTGIQDDGSIITAPDTANYLVTLFKIKNTSSTPLTITDGYGRDSTTGSVKDIMDTTGGSIFPAPDHVVPYSVGSGLTAGQAADLSATAAATANLNFNGTAVLANIVQVNSQTISGTGSDSDPWGP